MLRQVFIVKRNEVIYNRMFGNALTNSEMEDLSFKIQAQGLWFIHRTTSHFFYDCFLFPTWPGDH